MNPWVRRLLLAASGGGFVWAVVSLFSRSEELEPMDDTPIDPAAPTFPWIMVEKDKYLAFNAGQRFIAMRASAAEAGVTLPLSTAYRSREWQQRLYDAYQAYLAGGPWAPMAAKPGKSLHEKGLAIDIAGVNPKASNYNPARAAWLQANAQRYGWYNTGAYFSSPEPWHYAYEIPREGVALIA